jgi:hypothetical protein
MARAACVSVEMQRLGIAITHRRRDNVGGVVIGSRPTELTDVGLESAERISQSFVAMAGLSFTDDVPHYDQGQLKWFMMTWDRNDDHHKDDPAYKKKFIRSHANSKIDARNRNG